MKDLISALRGYFPSPTECEKAADELGRKAMQCAVLTVERDELRADLDAERDAAELKSACITGMRQEVTAWSITVTNLEAKLAELEQEANEEDALRERLSGLLTKSVNAIRGEPAELSRHSWHDLPELCNGLVEKLAEKTESEKKWIALHGAVCDIHDKAKAKLAALESQPAAAEVLLVDGEKVIDASMAFFDSVELGAKLYLAAGAAPVQQEPEPIQVCRLMKKEEGIWIAASEFYAGHPEQQWVELVSRNPDHWSIQRRVTGKQIADGLAKALAGTQAPAAKVPEEPRIDINDLSGMIAAVIEEQTP